MSNQEAITIIGNLEDKDILFNPCDVQDAKTMAIKALEQEPKYCDRNICIKNEYNGIGCDECEVTKSQEPKTDYIAHGTDGNLYKLTISNGKEFEQDPKAGYWKPYLKEGLTDMCSKCGSRFDRPWNYCPHCGARMVEP